MFLKNLDGLLILEERKKKKDYSNSQNFVI